MSVIGKTSEELSTGWRRWMIEAGPATFILAALFVKFVYASLTMEQPAPLERSVITAMFASVLILGAPLAWIGRLWRFIIAILLDFSLTVLLTSDRIHHRFFGDILSVAELPHAWQIGAVVSSITDKLQIIEVFYYVDILVALACLPFYIRLSRKTPNLNGNRQVFAGFVLIALGLLASVPTIRLIHQDRNAVFEWRAARRQIVGAIGFLPYHIFDLAIHLKTRWDSVQVTELQRERVRLFFNERYRASHDSSPLQGAARGLNVI